MRDLRPIDYELERGMLCTEVLAMGHGIPCSNAGVYVCASCGRRVCPVHMRPRNLPEPVGPIAYCIGCDGQIPRSAPDGQ